MLISIGCRTCARSLAGLAITFVVPDWAALGASTQTACNVTGVIDNRRNCLDFSNGPAAMQIRQAPHLRGKEEGQRGGAGNGVGEGGRRRGLVLVHTQDTCQAHTQLSCLQD